MLVCDLEGETLLTIPRHLLGRETKRYEASLRKSYVSGTPGINPLGLVLIVTTACNTTCSYCPYQKGTVSMEEPFLDACNAREVMSGFKQWGGRFVRFSGGEPLLHPNLPQLVEMAAGLGLHTTVVTNGLALADSGFPWMTMLSALTLSIDTLDERMTRELRGIDRDTYLARLDVLKAFRKFSPRTWVGANCVVSRRNIGSIPELVRELSQRRISVQFQPCHSFGSEENLSDYPAAEEVEELVAILEKMRSSGFLVNSSSSYLRKIVQYVEGNILQEDCSAGYYQAVIDPDLSVRFCCMLPPIGNLKDGTIQEVWVSEEAKRQRLAIRDNKCPRCCLMYMDTGDAG